MKHNYIPVEGVDSLVREKHSKGILNTNKDALHSYRLQRFREKNIDNVIKNMDSILRDISDLKEMVAKIVIHLGIN